MTTQHDRAMRHPFSHERNIVLMVQAAHDLLEDGHGENPQFRPAVVLLLEAIKIMADDEIGRLDRDELIEFVDHHLEHLNEGG